MLSKLDLDETQGVFHFEAKFFNTNLGNQKNYVFPKHNGWKWKG